MVDRNHPRFDYLCPNCGDEYSEEALGYDSSFKKWSGIIGCWCYRCGICWRAPKP